MRKSIAASIVAATAATSACGQHGSGDGGPTVSRSYQVGNFQQIEVGGAYDVDVRTGANVGVSATGPQKLLERTVVEVQGDKLLIHPEEHQAWFHFGSWNSGTAHFTVTVPQLSAATIAGSGDIQVDHVKGERFEGTVAGSGGLGIGTIDVQSLKLFIGGSGDAKAAAGHAASAEYEIGGSGGVDAGGVATQQMKVSVAGSGNIKANSSGPAEVDISGSGDVEITGGAKCTINKAGSGNVRCS